MMIIPAVIHSGNVFVWGCFATLGQLVIYEFCTALEVPEGECLVISFQSKAQAELRYTVKTTYEWLEEQKYIFWSGLVKVLT